MKCKFENGKVCYNCGSPLYLNNCRPRLCASGVKMTNADRIRAMSDEELADFLAFTWATSARAWQKDPGETLYWLQQPAEEADHG